MNAHELAIAALHQVSHSSSSSRHRDASAAKTASLGSIPSATDSHMDAAMANSATGDDVAAAQESYQPFPGTPRVESQVAEETESVNHATLDSQPTWKTGSQSTTDGPDGVSTPPTSTSDDISSQNTNQEGQLSQLSQLSQLAAAQQPLASNISPTRPSLSTVAAAAGQKRTADGQVKSSVGTSPGSPNQPPARRHSRNTSGVSNVSSATSSRIGEISSELRTRLSYAMVKVNNGWQSNSIDEVESLASQAGSPTSSTSTVHGRRIHLASPRTTIDNMQGQSNSMSQHTSPVTQQPTADFDLYSRAEPQSRTYESFWRDHSTVNNIQSHRQSTQAPILSPPASRVSLAPPADIRPTINARRSYNGKLSKPPTIPGQNSSGHSFNTSAPRTPNRGNDFTDTIQTPTQKTIQEQDAIETLLFMSSPGNSGNMGSAMAQRTRNQASPQRSPLKAEFSAQVLGVQGRRVGFERGLGSAGSSEAGGVYNSGRMMMSGKTSVRDGSREDAIDQLLDEMADSSSDEEELVLNYSSPRRVAAGRV